MDSQHLFVAKDTDGSKETYANLDQLRSLLNDAKRDYEKNHARSLSLHKDASKALPGGNTRSVLHIDPFPICMDRGQGNRLTDVDGHEYVSPSTSPLFSDKAPYVLDTDIFSLPDIWISSAK